MGYFINFTLLALIYFFLYRNWSRKPKKLLIINTLMYIYIVSVLFVTLMPFTFPFGGSNNLFIRTANFIPFKDLRLNRVGAVREIFLNVVMLMPFGFLSPIIKKKGLLGTVIMTFLFSLTIEFFQLLSSWRGGISSRTFDATDLITNTLGGVIGYFIFVVLRPLVFKILKDNES